MVGPSKILTVSYGTFSCTLEGFDDPFSTMREIAEYFRDLAAEDRYFGAEPPTPDAEMLHRIAEREVRKRVEARVEEDGIVLRQVEGKPSAPAAAPEPAAAPQLAPEPAAPPAEEAAESVAAKLARIRAAAAQDIAHDRDTYVEDASAEDISVGTPISAAFQDVEEEPPAEEAAEEIEEEATTPEAREEAATEEEHEESESKATTQAEPAQAEAGAAGETAGEETDEEVEEDPAATPAPDRIAIARVVRIRRSQFKAAVMAEEFQEAPEEAEKAGPEAAQAPAEEKEETREEPTAPQTSSEPQEPDQPSEEEAAQAAGAEVQEPAGEESPEEAAPPAAEETAGETPEKSEKPAAGAERAETEETEEPEKSPEPESSLSPEDEAELRATLEQIQREAEAERRAEKEGRALLEQQDIESSPNSVSRILEVTNSELEESEGSRRRSAIAHLKAAVAATRADKQLSRRKAEEEAEELNQYREDLARVVRPRRPAEAGRPAERRMPPLMLVSEQRVDLPSQGQPAPERGGAVRPRRITTGNLALDEHGDAGMGEGEAQENIFRDERTFTEFARRTGATELIDQMEAAAAYFTFIEGRPHFNRPQVMRAVAALNENKDFSREEGLRAFGRLLRSGRIVKVGRGRFRVSEASRFNPDARVAGE